MILFDKFLKEIKDCNNDSDLMNIIKLIYEEGRDDGFQDGLEYNE